MRNRLAFAVGHILFAAMLLSALVAACSDPPPPPTFQQFQMQAPANTPPGSPIAPPPKGMFAPVDAGPQAPLVPLREEHPNQPDSVNVCVEAWLVRHHLNDFGDPPDTSYPGGTPLFNERTGQRIDRMDYIFSRNAQARADCAPRANPR